MIGRTISHYKIVDKLGEGGMGTVWKAEDTTLNRLVAIKALSQSLSENKEARERFIREAQAASSLNHANITTVHELLEDEGEQFIVMEYVESKTIRDIVESSHVSIRKAVDIIIQAAEALEAAHNKGILHRDVKSANIMVSMEGNVKVMDFGLAHLEERSQLTRTGTTMGTLAYSSPEQLTGAPVDRKSEVFSLGCVFYELLTGQPPFKSPSEGELLFEIINTEQDRPSKLRDDVPEKVEAVVTRMLEKKPELRYQSCGELLADLKTIRGELETTSVELSTARSAIKIRKKRLITLSAAAAVVVIGAVVILLSGRGGLTLDPDLVAVADFDNRTGNETLDYLGGYAAEWISQNLQRMQSITFVPYTDAMYAWQNIRTSAESGRLSAKPLRAFSEETGAGIVVSGSYYLDGPNLQFQITVTDEISNNQLGPFEPVVGPSDSPSHVVELLPEQVMGLLTSRFYERLAGEAGRMLSPPSVEAYQEFKEGVEDYIRMQFDDAIQHLYTAHAIDSTFHRSLIYAVLCCMNANRDAERDSLVTELIGYRSQLTEYESCWLEYFTEVSPIYGRKPGFRDRTYEAFRRAADIAPRSKAVYNLALEAVRSNRPHAAIEALESLDPDRGSMRGWSEYWNIMYWGYKLIGDFRRGLKAARTGRRLYSNRSNLWLREAEALAALGRKDELNDLLDECLTSFTDSTPGECYLRAARYLKVYGHDRHIWEELYERAIQWYENEPGRTSPRRASIAEALYGLERWDEARSLYEELEATYPDNSTYKAYIGLLAAQRNDLEEVQRIDTWLGGDTGEIHFRLWYRARIATVLGDHIRAINMLREALSRGLDSEMPLGTIEFVQLKDIPQYRNLISPKG